MSCNVAGLMGCELRAQGEEGKRSMFSLTVRVRDDETELGPSPIVMACRRPRFTRCPAWW